MDFSKEKEHQPRPGTQNSETQNTVDSPIEIHFIIAGQYNVIRPLGRGGYGEVYLVSNLYANGDLLALKILVQEKLQDPEAVSRFIEEALIGQKLNNKHIVAVRHIGKTEDGLPFFTMDYVEGESLMHKLVKKGEGLPFKEVLSILYYLAAALKDVHDEGIIHRDLKPGNIFISDKNFIKLGDFGIAKKVEEEKLKTFLSQPRNQMSHSTLDKGSTAAIGTFGYFSQEQWAGEVLDARADIYSYGIIAFELATGHHPGDYHRKTGAKDVRKYEIVPYFTDSKSDIPSWFQTFVEKCCENNKEKRYRSMSEIARELFIKAQREGVEITSLDVLIDRKVDKKKDSLKSKPDNFFSKLSDKIISTTKDLFGNFIRSAEDANPVLWKVFLAVLVGFINLAYMVPELGFESLAKTGYAYEMKVLDELFQKRGPIPPPKDVVMIYIDSESKRALKVPNTTRWPRELTAELLEKMAEYKPKAVVLDYLYDGLTSVEADQRFANALRLIPSYIGKMATPETRRIGDGSYIVNLKVTNPEELFVSNSKGVFLGNLQMDTDSVVRHFIMSSGGKKINTPMEDIVNDMNSILGPTSADRDFINFYGGPNTIENYSFYKVIVGEIADPQKVFEGKYIFIGEKFEVPTNSDARPADNYFTPFEDYTTGLEIHATSLGNIIGQSWIKRTPFVVDVLCLVLLPILVTCLILVLEIYIVAFLAVAVYLGWSYLTEILFSYQYFIFGSLFIYILLPVILFIRLVMELRKVTWFRRLLKI